MRRWRFGSHEGRILQWDGTALQTIYDDLFSPTGLTVDGTTLYVSEEFAGRVIAIRLDLLLTN